MEQTLTHFRTMAESVPVPFSGDFRDGFATVPLAPVVTGAEIERLFNPR